MNWTPNRKPTPSVSNYDHTMLMSPIGEFIIEWKSWKENPSYDITLKENEWIGCEYSLEEAKAKVEEYLKSKYKELSSFLGMS